MMPTPSETRSPTAAPPGECRVLVATDLGPNAESPLRIAHSRALAAGGAMAVVHVVDGDAAIAGADAALRALLRDTLGSAGDDVDVRVVIGDPAEQIAAMATAWNASLLIVGRSEPPSGVIARMFAPGAVARLVRNAPCDVLVSGRAPATGRIVVGINLDEPSVPILRAAAAEQARRPVTVYAIHCVEDGVAPSARHAQVPAALERAAADVGLTAVPSVVEDDPSRGLVATAKELAADLIIVGSHGEAGRARLLLGSIAQDVVEVAPCPVLVVRMPDAPH